MTVDNSMTATPVSRAPRPAVCVVLAHDDGRLLAVSRRNDTTRWGLPGGKVDDGESNLDAAVRETQEELGIALNPNALEPLYCAMCPGKGPDDTFWVTTYLFKGSAPELLELRAEAGLYVQWMEEQDLADPQHSPFAAYNEGVLQALRQYFALR